MEYKFKVFNRHSKDFKFIITKDGHTMLPEDAVKDLNRTKFLEKENEKLKEDNKEMLELCILGYQLTRLDEKLSVSNNRFKAAVEKIKGKSIEEVLKNE